MRNDALIAPLVGSELATRMRTFRDSLSPEARAVLDEVLAAAADQQKHKGGSAAAGFFFLQFTFKVVGVKTI